MRLARACYRAWDLVTPNRDFGYQRGGDPEISVARANRRRYAIRPHKDARPSPGPENGLSA